MFVVAIEACPSQACTVTGSTPRASHRHAAVWRRSWIRRPGAAVDQPTDRFTAEACSPWPVPVVRSRSSGPLPSASACTNGSTRSATGTRRFLPDFVALASTPSGAARETSSTGIGTRTKSRTRTSRSSDHRSPVHDATSRMSARCSSRAATDMWKDSSSSSANGRISVRTPRPLGTRVRVTGFEAINRSLTAQAKNDDREAQRGLVTVRNDGVIKTDGALSNGVYAQSIGGGGGSGAFSLSGAFSSSGGATSSVGGTGAGGGDGGDVVVADTGTIILKGPGSVGVYAQWIGGGGGNAGFSGALNFTGGELKNTVGGAGKGGDGGNVTVTSTGSIETLGAGSDAVVAQSIGGGGGSGSFAVAAQNGRWTARRSNSAAA